MAYDKVVDSSVLDAGLKQIADAIREKGGTSDNLAFPTAMANAIAAIEAGGIAGYFMQSGSITVTEVPTEYVSITHETTPQKGDADLVLVFEDIGNGDFNSGSNALHMAFAMTCNKTTKNCIHYGSTSTKGYGSIMSIYTNSFYLQEEVYKKMIPGVIYTWIRLSKE